VTEYSKLRDANSARRKEWDKEDKITLSYRGNELAGEAGEACNIIKKLERERLGIRGSRATREQLADELADVVICSDLIAMCEDIDLEAAVAQKFNATSAKVGLKTRLRTSDVAPLAYLASPHTHYPAGVDAAWRDICAIAARLITTGVCVYSPIVCTHLLQGHGAPPYTDHAFWLKFDEPMMRVCDVLIVVHMPSWETSNGIAMEVAHFEQAGKPIFDMDPETLVMTRRAATNSTRLTLYPAPELPELDRLIKESLSRFDALDQDEQSEHRHAQRKSLIIGEIMLAHPEMTREEAGRLYDSVGGLP
jgi:NTP pyrophosphatase (non-canonical NTP hydrolase)